VMKVKEETNEDTKSSFFLSSFLPVGVGGRYEAGFLSPVRKKED